MINNKILIVDDEPDICDLISDILITLRGIESSLFKEFVSSISITTGLSEEINSLEDLLSIFLLNDKSW